MKTVQIFKSTSLFLFLLLPFLGWAVDDFPREIRKSFDVNSNVKLLSHMNFADLNISLWDQNRMEIIVKMDVSASNEKRANEIYDKIKITITESTTEPKIQVEVNNLKCSNNEQWNVDVEVKMPKNGAIYGDNSFGDLNAEVFYGRCEMTLDYGKIKIGSLKGKDNRLNVSFGDLKIDDLNSSEVKLEYGNAKLGTVRGDFRAKVAYGDIMVSQVDASCKLVQVTVEYGDADLVLGSGYGATFEASASFGDVDLPSSASVTRKETDYTSSRKTGTIGNGNGTLKIEASFGDVDIR